MSSNRRTQQPQPKWIWVSVAEPQQQLSPLRLLCVSSKLLSSNNARPGCDRLETLVAAPWQTTSATVGWNSTGADEAWTQKNTEPNNRHICRIWNVCSHYQTRTALQLNLLLVTVNIRDVKMAQVALWFDLNFELIKLLFSSISTGKLSPKHNLCDPNVEKHWPNPTCYWTVAYFGLHQYNPLIFFPAAKRLVKIVSKDWNRHWQGYY